MPRSLVLAGVLATFLLTLGCKRGPAEALQPNVPTASDALGSKSGAVAGASGKCVAVEDYGKPLVVDLKGEERGDFEVAMKEGVAVVTYDCNTLRLVDGCNVQGTYGFVGLSPKEELVRLENEDELKANLPISAGAFGAKLGGEMQRGMTLDIAMMIIGKRRTTLRATTRGDLIEDRGGACKRATHFVRGATVGAFAMESGTRAKVRTAAEVLGLPVVGSIGVGGGSSASRSNASRDGSVADCKEASSEASSAPARCGAILRLELTAIDAGGEATRAANPAGGRRARVTAPADDEDADRCPSGFVLSAGKCSPRATAQVHRCNAAVPSECEAQCEKGDAPSCARFGALVLAGRAGGRPDAARAAGLFRKSCAAGWEAGCGSLGALQMFGEGVPRDAEGGAAIVQKACSGGSIVMCEMLGVQLAIGKLLPADRARAAPLLRRACDGGMGMSCAVLGDLLQHGEAGLPRDVAKGTQLMRRACDGGEALGCIGWAHVTLQDGGTKDDEARAVRALESVCTGPSEMAPEGCGRLGLLLASGQHAPKDEARASQLLKKACAAERRWCQAAQGGGGPSSATTNEPAGVPPRPARPGVRRKKK